MSINVKIDSLDHQGRGIAHHNGKVIFIPNTIPGEEAEIELIIEKKNYSIGKVIKYNVYSINRNKVKCPYYLNCGGCNISHFFYDKQIEFKTNNLINILSKYGNLNINPKIIELNNVFYYRNKITLKILNYKWGYYKEETHEFIEIKHCMIAKDSINKIIDNKKLFNIKDGEILIRSNYNDELLISINSNRNYEIDISNLRKENKIVGIIVNDKIVHGEDFFMEKINNYFFKVNYKSFFQINLNILEKVFEILGQKKYKTIIDLYCGVGTLGIPVKKEKLFGIEISSSVKDALYNAKLNKQSNNFYILGNAAKIKEIKDIIDMIIIDPPRKGSDIETLDYIIKSNSKELIYMSCNPVTLARDLNILKNHYKINDIYLLDMFPQTYHIETIVMLKKL